MFFVFQTDCPPNCLTVEFESLNKIPFFIVTCLLTLFSFSIMIFDMWLSLTTHKPNVKLNFFIFFSEFNQIN